MQTILLRRDKGLTNDQMRMICAIIAVTLLMVNILSDNWRQGIWTSVNINIRAQAMTQSQMDIKAAYKIGNTTAMENSRSGEYLFESSVLTTSKMFGLRKGFVDKFKCKLNAQIEGMILENAAIVEEEQQVRNIDCDASDITKISNLTKDEIGLMLQGTWLEGKENILYQAETEENINVFFMYAVSTLESEFGTSPRAVNRSNFYGLETMADYSSYENNTLYFADMMNRLYVNNDSIGSNLYNIGPVYCPPNPLWAEKIEEIMQQEYKKICELTVA